MAAFPIQVGWFHFTVKLSVLWVDVPQELLLSHGGLVLLTLLVQNQVLSNNRVVFLFFLNNDNCYSPETGGQTAV